MSASRDGVISALSKIVDPASGKDLISGGMAKAISVNEEGSVNFVIEVDPALGDKAEPFARRRAGGRRGCPWRFPRECSADGALD